MVRIYEIMKMKPSHITLDILNSTHSKEIDAVVKIYLKLDQITVGYSMNPEDVMPVDMIDDIVYKLQIIISNIQQSIVQEKVHAIDIARSIIDYLEGR